MSRLPCPSRVAFPLAVAALWLMVCGDGRAAIRDSSSTGFTVIHELDLPGVPTTIFDAMTGDISGWWDHSFSESPRALYIEPKPGGGFYETFDASGHGALHATVTYADRGKLLRFVGQLGLSGQPLSMVHSVEFAPLGTDSTRVTLTVRAFGQIAAGWATAVDGAWRHFLFERFKAYVENGRKPLPKAQR
ncbi:MAG: hypothetical protein AB1792_07075 [Candidatus Zixiibacteriota bacterium]